LHQLLRHKGNAEQVWTAVQHGYMMTLSDIDGAEAAAIPLAAPELPAISLAIALGDRNDATLIAKLRTAVPHSHSPYVWNCWANLLRDHLQCYDEAETAYRMAIELEPMYGRPWADLGRLYRRLDRYSTAEVAYRKAIDLDPNLPYPWIGLGRLLQ